MGKRESYGIKLQIDSMSLRDERFAFLGDLTGRGKWDARARVEALWFDCLEQTRDLRTAEEIAALCGWFDGERGSFAEMLVKANLAEYVPSASEQTDAEAKQMLGHFRIKGMRERMEWLVELRSKRRKNASEGGKKASARAKRGPGGRFEAANTEQMLGDEPSKIQVKPGGFGFGIGFGSGIVSGSENNTSEKKSKKPKPKAGGQAGEGVSTPTWEAYSTAYRERHGVYPVRNKEINTALKRFTSKLPLEECPSVAAFYLTHNDAFYVKSKHPVSLLVRDAEKLRTEWITGRQSTMVEARHLERKQATFNVFDELIAEAKAREEQNA